VLVVKTIEVTDAFAPQVPAATDAEPVDFPLKPAALAIGGTRATPSSRTVAMATVLHALRWTLRCIGGQ
jgi:hypothetical protein